MAKVLYKRQWRPSSPTIGDDEIHRLIQQRKLAELRAAVENGEWQQQEEEDSSDTESNLSTSCTASPKSAKVTGQELSSKYLAEEQQQEHDSAAAEEQRQRQREAELAAAELARKEAEKEQLQIIYDRLLQEQAVEEQKKLAEKQLLEEQHAEATQQITQVQQRLDELRESKHDLVKQLKQAMQAEAAAKQQAAAAAQQAALQQQHMQMQLQQQEQWQHQQQQQHPAYRGLTPLGIPAPPRPNAPGALTPGPTPSSYTPGYTPSHQTPAGAFTPSSSLVSPGATRSQWLFSTPAQPPPPRQLQQQQIGDQTTNTGGYMGPPSTHGGPGMHQYSSHHHHQQQQQQQLQQQRAPSWGQPPRPGGSSSGPDSAAAGGADVHMQDVNSSRPPGRQYNMHDESSAAAAAVGEGFQQQHQQHQGLHSSGSSWQEQQQQQQQQGATGRPGMPRSPRQSFNGGSGPSSRVWQGSGPGPDELHLPAPPDSPEEGEVGLASPPRGLHHHRARAAAAAAAGGMGGSSGLHESPGLSQLPMSRPSAAGPDRSGNVNRLDTASDRLAGLPRSTSASLPLGAAAAAAAAAAGPADKEHSRYGSGLMRSSSSSIPGSGEYHSQQQQRQGLLRSSSEGLGGAGSRVHATAAPLASPPGPRVGRSPSGLLDGREGKYENSSREVTYDGKYENSSRGAAAAGVNSFVDGPEGGVFGGSSSRQRGGLPYYPSGSNALNAAGGAGGSRVPAEPGLWRVERRRSSGSNIDRFGDAAEGGGYQGEQWGQHVAGGVGGVGGGGGGGAERAWGRSGAGGVGAGGHTEQGAPGERKPWGRNPNRNPNGPGSGPYHPHGWLK